MITKTLAMFALMLGVQSVTMLASAEATYDAPVIEPEPSVQAWIKQVVTLETQQQLLKAIAALKIQGFNTAKIIPQLVYFQVNAKEIYSTEHITAEEMSKRTMVANGVIAFLLEWDTRTQKPTSASSLTILKAVLPYLPTLDRQMRKELYHTLEWVDQMQGGQKDFTYYESFLKTSTNGLTNSLIGYMYDCDRSAAVLSMARVYGNKATQSDLADQIKGDSKTALQSLADRPEWWAHLYVAETMKKQPQLRDVALLKKLEKNDNPLVKEIIADIISGK